MLFSIKSFNHNKGLIAGLSLLLCGILLPAILKIDLFKIYTIIKIALEMGDSGLLVTASFLLIILNSLRALPIYLGAFVLCSSITENKIWFRVMVPLNIGIIYLVNSYIHKIQYDFSYSLIIAVFIIYLLDNSNLLAAGIIRRSAIVIFVLIGVQFLDVIPHITKYGFGHGEVSMDIKASASLIDEYGFLTFSSVTMLIIFLSIALLIRILLNDQQKLLTVAQKLAVSDMRALEARKNSEIRSLMHDLKTPLTTIQGLAGVILLITSEIRVKEYTEKIVDSVDSANNMISQIMYEEQSCVITTEELVNYIKFQIVSPNERGAIIFENNGPDLKININKILFSRAIINLINNSFAAMDKSEHKVIVSIVKNGGNVDFTVKDNGCGIKACDMKKIWDLGFSERGSTGIGLNFVREIVNSCQGKIDVASSEGAGTSVTISIKEAAEDG